MAAIADNLVKDLKRAGVTGIRVEGLRQGDWVLIDAGDVIVHVFRPEVRSFYSLEKMWSVGPPGREAIQLIHSVARCVSSSPPSDA